MDSRATHLIRVLIAAAIVAVAAPVAQGGNRNHQAPVPDPVRAAYTAAWQAYRGLPGGPPASTLAQVQGRAYSAAWQAYRGLPVGPPARTVPDVRRSYTAAWQAYRGLPGGPPASTRTGYPQPATGPRRGSGIQLRGSYRHGERLRRLRLERLGNWHRNRAGAGTAPRRRAAD